MLTIENSFFKASFKAEGAELKSLVHKATETECMWSGDPAFWGRTSPTLFPIVGKLKNNSYIYDNKVFNLEKHGFVRDALFQVEHHSDTEICFSFSANAQTKEHYPFDFLLLITYILEGSQLSCSYTVKNKGQNTMYFSIGGHPAFAIGNAQYSYSDFALKFNKDEALLVSKVEESGLISDDQYVQPLVDGKLQLAYHLFYNDALVMKSMKSNCISILQKNGKAQLDFKFNGFPFFGIWASKDADFVCLEPWCGIADGENHQQLLQDKEGIETLLPSDGFERTWSVAWQDL